MNLIRSKSVSAVSTFRVIAFPLSASLSIPSEPGRMVHTKMMPNITAQIVVVK